MRQFPGVRQQKKWKRKDEVSLLGTTSPSNSPPTYDLQHHHHVEHPQKQNRDVGAGLLDWPSTPQTPQQQHISPSMIQPRNRQARKVTTMAQGSDPQSIESALQFVAAYEDEHIKVVPAPTQASASTPSTVMSTPSPASTRQTQRLEHNSQTRFQASSAGNSYTRSNSNGSNDKKKGSTMGRIASLFTSRSVVYGGKTAAAQSQSPQKSSNNNNNNNSTSGNISPSRSSETSSGGYVGWPGTQNKDGGVVAVKSSFEESEIGFPHSQGQTQTLTHAHAHAPGHAIRYEDQMQQAANQQVTMWMDNDESVDDFSEQDTLSTQYGNPRDHVYANANTNGYDQSTPPPPPDNHQTAADFHLAAVVADARVSASSPIVKQQQQHGHAHSPVAGNNRHSPVQHGARPQQLRYDIYGDKDAHADPDPIQHLHSEDKVSSPKREHWNAIDNLSDASPSTAYSKTSSAYFSSMDVQAKNPAVYGIADRNRHGAASVMRGLQPLYANDSYQTQAQLQPQAQPQPPTAEALALNDHFHPAHRTFNAVNAFGFNSLLDKTQDVPNLMDDLESASTFSHATSTHSYNNAPATASQQKSGQRLVMVPKKHAATQGRRLRDQPSTIEENASSDIFDGVRSLVSAAKVSNMMSATAFGRSTVQPRNAPTKKEQTSKAVTHSNLGIESKATGNYTPQVNADPTLNVVLLGGGLTTIQTTATDFTKRITASDYDETLSTSDYDEYGFAQVPSFHTLLDNFENPSNDKNDDVKNSNSNNKNTRASPSLLGASSLRLTEDSLRTNYEEAESESGSSLFSNPYGKEGWGPMYNDLSKYYVHPNEMKKVVRKFRKLSKARCSKLNAADRFDEEDAIKAFALAEMRSRIMEKDIERRLERRGWTTIVDDIVDTPRGRAALRSRDTVIVAKAWRDGANPADIVRSSQLTRRDERAYYLWRPSRRQQQGYWEEVRWQDDNEFCLQQCASVGSRCLRGHEMFTIGDCQSMLLKLTNDYCTDLRDQLDEATARQIDAEDIVKAEGDSGQGFMTEAEMTYLNCMENVKVVSQRLVIAENAFHCVKERIENLVARYESILVSIENDTESMVASSVMTYESSCYSEDCDDESYDHHRENETLARRAQRAELRAELAAREAMLAKEETRLVREEKEREVQDLRMKLQDLQSEASTAISQHQRSILVRAMSSSNVRSAVGSSAMTDTNRSKIDEVKQRFRAKSQARMSGAAIKSQQQRVGTAYSASSQQVRASQHAQNESRKNDRILSMGEEMFQHLDFYERSLNAVKTGAHVNSNNQRGKNYRR